jgi:hypothetical protein
MKLPHCPGPLSRRTALQIGGAGALGIGLGLSDLARLRAASAAEAAVDGAPVPAQDTSVIFVWLPGGPPHMEMYDLKPDAPAEYRGEFRPIATNVPGVDVCELLPLHARAADKYTLVRSVAHEFADHGGGHKRFLTGRLPKEPTGFVNDSPCVASFVARLREGRGRGVPDYVAGADGGRTGVDVFSFGAAYLGQATTPFVVGGDPSAPGFKVENLGVADDVALRLDDRVRLLADFDQLRRQVDASGVMGALDEFNGRALDLLTSQRAREAFDLEREDAVTRERYGMHAYGQRCLMARRLVEAGASWVTMVLENPLPNKTLPEGVIYNWDSHAVNGHLFADARVRFPLYDQAVTALVEDVYARGLERRVLVIVTGEFGRTPRISTYNGRPGRDHWPGAMSMLLCGGGMRTGQVVGATNPRGEYPVERVLTPNDLWATVYRHLGIDYELSFPDYQGRPMPILPFGAPVAELLPA